MTVVLETIGPCRRKLKIDIPADRVTQQLNEVMGLYKRSARLPGFRPGKAPANLVQNHYKKEILKDATERLIPQAYQEAVREQKLAVLAVVDAEQPELKANEPYQFSIIVDVRPEFTLPEYKGIPIQVENKEITDADIEQGVQDARRSQGKFTELAEGAVEAGDLVQIDFTGVPEGDPVDASGPEVASLLSGQAFWTRTDEQAFLPELVKGLVGAAKGATVEVVVTLPADFHAAALAGRAVKYTVTVLALRRLQLPELNEDFFRKAGVENLEGLRERVAAQLRKNKELMDAYLKRGKLQEYLLEKTPMELPESAVGQETRRFAEDFIRQRLGEGMDEQVLRQHSGQIFEGAGQQAQQSLRYRFILAEIAAKEDINPTAEEISGELNRLANQYKMDARTVEERLRQNGHYDKVLEDIRNNKTIDFLVSQANITA